MVLECFSTCGSLAEKTIFKYTNMEYKDTYLENSNIMNEYIMNENINTLFNPPPNNPPPNNPPPNNPPPNNPPLRGGSPTPPNIKMNIMNPKNMNGVDLITLVICTLPAVVIATKCNPKTPVLMGIIAFLFDRIYLFQHVIRKYILRENNYCNKISCK